MAENKKIYLDHSASTPVDKQVIEAMLPYFGETYGNASGLHQQARDSAAALDRSRKIIASILNCSAGEIVFTGCGTESDNLAIRGAAWSQFLAGKGNHIITSAIEHHAVLHTVEQLCTYFGFESTFLPVDHFGMVDPAALEKAIRPQTILISIMYANNEVGTIQPLKEIGRIAREHGIPFHTDAVQAAGSLPLDVEALKVDLLAISGHKFYAPKGVGALYVRKGTKLIPTQTGGGHENNRRAGTENIPYIVGLVKALELCLQKQPLENARLTDLREHVVGQVLEEIPGAHLSGHPSQRLPGHISLVFENADAGGMLMHLDLQGICASSGSACTTGMPEPSHVLEAMGFPRGQSLGALRLTMGRQTSEEDMEIVLRALPAVVRSARELNPAAII
jgi:cysteine desulfurase